MKKNNKIIIVVIIILAILSLSFFYFYHPKKEEKSTIKSYDGQPFVYVNSLWKTQVHKKPWLYEMQMHYYPGDLEGIKVEGNLTEFFPSNMTFISFIPLDKMGNYALAISELMYNFANGFYMVQKDPLNPISVCSVKKYDYCVNEGFGQVINCTNKDKKVISFRDSDVPKIILENNNCIAIYGNQTTILPATERLLYELFGVMNNSRINYHDAKIKDFKIN